jgi:hypothetical protein
VHYDLLMHSFAKVTKAKVKNKKGKIISAFSDLCGDAGFQRTLSGGIQNKASILKRRELWSKRLNPILGA